MFENKTAIEKRITNDVLTGYFTKYSEKAFATARQKEEKMMSNRYIIESVEDQETGKEKTYLFHNATLALKCLSERLIFTPEQYQERVNAFWQRIEEFLGDAHDGEVYHVYDTWRNDLLGKYPERVRSNIFCKMENIYKMIAKTNDYYARETVDVGEDLHKMHYWTIEKYRVICGEYECIFGVHLLGPGAPLKIEFYSGASYEEISLDNAFCAEWKYLYGRKSPRGYNMDFPYQKGDILKIDERPFFDSSLYYVYLGGGRAVKKDENGCLRDTDLVSDLNGTAHSGFPLCRLEVVPSCPDDGFDQIASIIRENRDRPTEEIKKKLMQEGGADGLAE